MKKVGIPRALLYSEFSPLIIPFLRVLGAEPIVSGRTNRRIIEKGIEKVAAEPCFPVKVLHGHVADLLEKRVDFIFMPTLVNTGKPTGKYPYSMTCPWVQSSPDVVRATFGLDNIISPALNFDWGTRFLEEQMKEAAARMGLSTRRVPSALEVGIRNKKAFDQQIKQRGKEILAGIQEEEIALVIIARPYTLYDPALNMNTGRKVRDLGYLPIPVDYLPFEEQDVSETVPSMCWIQGQKKLAALSWLNEKENLFGISMTHFSCGPDSFVDQFTKHLFEKPFTILEIDEHTGDAGIDTRIDAFIRTVRSYVAKKRKAKNASYHLLLRSVEDAKDRRIMWPPMNDHVRVAAAVLRAHGLDSGILDGNPDEAMELARDHTFGLACTPYLTTTGFMIQEAEKPGFDPDTTVFFQAKSIGPCRLSQYAVLENLTFQKLGINAIVISALGPEIKISVSLLMGLWMGIAAMDQLEKMRLHTRPYEINEGAADAIFAKYRDEVAGYFEDTNNKLDTRQKRAAGFLGNAHPEIYEILRRAQKEFASVERRDKKRPLIGLVGEYFVRFHEPSNQYIIRKLEKMGTEVWLTPTTEFLTYCCYLDYAFAATRFRLYRKKRDLLEWVNKWYIYTLMSKCEHKLFKSTLPYMHGFEDAEAKKVLMYGTRYMNLYHEGEAILSIGKALELYRKGVDGLISVAPFSCMPGTTIAGLIPGFRKDNNNIPFISIEYDGYADSAREIRIATFVAQVMERNQGQKERYLTGS